MEKGGVQRKKSWGTFVIPLAFTKDVFFGAMLLFPFLGACDLIQREHSPCQKVFRGDLCGCCKEDEKNERKRQFVYELSQPGQLRPGVRIKLKAKRRLKLNDRCPLLPSRKAIENSKSRISHKHPYINMHTDLFFPADPDPDFFLIAPCAILSPSPPLFTTLHAASLFPRQDIVAQRFVFLFLFGGPSLFSKRNH